MEIKTPFLAAEAVIVKDGKIVLMKRKFPPFKDVWSIPGGTVDVGETIKEAVVREVKEEVNLNVKPVKLIGIYDSPKRNPTCHSVACVFLCKIMGDEKNLEPGLEALDAKSFDINKIPENLAFDNEKVLTDVFGNDFRNSYSKKNKVLVGGVFSIIHPGHIFFLKKAKSLGDELIVIIANDETVSLTGKPRIFSVEERKSAIENLDFVDKVRVGYDLRKTDLFKIIEEEKPDIIALGYDQDIDNVSKEKIKEAGLKCKIIKIDKLGDYSTRKIFKMIKESC